MGVMFVLEELVMGLSTDIFRVVGDCRFGLMIWFSGSVSCPFVSSFAFWGSRGGVWGGVGGSPSFLVRFCW